MDIVPNNVPELMALEPDQLVASTIAVEVSGRPSSPLIDSNPPVVVDESVVIPVSATQQLMNAIGSTDNIRFTSPAPNLVNHLKRLAVSELPRPWKKYIQSKTVSVADDMSIVVQHKNGKLIVSPKKNRLGRPPGSKNCPKSMKQLAEEGLVIPSKLCLSSFIFFSW